MSPIYDRKQAREAGWAQVRAVLQSFEGDVIRVETGQWGGQLLDDNGNPLPPKEFFEVECANVKVKEASEPLSMNIDGANFTFRVNMSEYTGSFWVEKFLASADEHKLLLPDGLKGKRILWKKETLQGSIPKFNATNFVIAGVVGQAAPQTGTAQPAQVEEAVNVETPSEEDDPMQLALELAVGKTEAQFRSAVSLHPKFINSPLLPLAKAGAITQALVNEGKLVLVQEGNKQVYKKVE